MKKIKDLKKQHKEALAELEDARGRKDKLLQELQEAENLAGLRGKELGLALIEGREDVAGIAGRINEAKTSSAALAEAIKIQDEVIENLGWYEKSARRELAEAKIRAIMKTAVEKFMEAGPFFEEMEAIAADLRELYTESRKIDGAWQAMHSDYIESRGHPDTHRQHIYHFADALQRSISIYEEKAEIFADRYGVEVE